MSVVKVLAPKMPLSGFHGKRVSATVNKQPVDIKDIQLMRPIVETL
jgi:hypothetical protein